MSRNKTAQNATVSDTNSSKFANSNLNAIFQKPQPQRLSSAAGQRHGMLLLGGAKTTRARAQPGGAKLAVPKPVNLPSIKKEHAGNDPATQLVPAGSTAGGWKTDDQQQHQQPPQTTHPSKQQPVPSTALANEAKVAITAGSTWGSALSSRGPIPSEAAVPYASFGPGSRSFPGRGESERLNPVEYPSLGSAAVTQPRPQYTPASSHPREEPGRRNWDDDEREPLAAPTSLRPQNADWFRREAERDKMEDERYTGRAPPVAPSAPLANSETTVETPEDFGFGGPPRSGFFPDGPRGLLGENAPFGDRRDFLSSDRFDREVQREIFGRAMFDDGPVERDWRGGAALEDMPFPGARPFNEPIRPPPLPPGPPPREREEKKSEVDLEREAYKAEVASVFRQQEEEREQKRIAEEKPAETEPGPEVEAELLEPRPDSELSHTSPPQFPASVPNPTQPSLPVPTPPVVKPLPAAPRPVSVDLSGGSALVDSPPPPPPAKDVELVSEEAPASVGEASLPKSEPPPSKTRLVGKMMPRSERAQAERKAYEDEETARKANAALKLKALEEKMDLRRKEEEERLQQAAESAQEEQECETAGEVAVDTSDAYDAPLESGTTADPVRDESADTPPLTDAVSSWNKDPRSDVDLTPTCLPLTHTRPGTYSDEVLDSSRLLDASRPPTDQGLADAHTLPVQPESTGNWNAMPGLLDSSAPSGPPPTSSWGVVPRVQGEAHPGSALSSSVNDQGLPNIAPGLGPLFMGGEAMPSMVFTTGGVLDQPPLDDEKLPLGLNVGPVPTGLSSVRPPSGGPGPPAVSFIAMPPPPMGKQHPQVGLMHQGEMGPSVWPGPPPVFGNGLGSLVSPIVTGMPAPMMPVSLGPSVAVGQYGAGASGFAPAPGAYLSAEDTQVTGDVMPIMMPPSSGHPVVAMPSLGHSMSSVPPLPADTNGGTFSAQGDGQSTELHAKVNQGGALAAGAKRGNVRRGREQEEKDAKRGASGTARERERRGVKDDATTDEITGAKGAKGGRGTGRAVPVMKEASTIGAGAAAKGEGSGKGRKGEGTTKGIAGRKGKGGAEASLPSGEGGAGAAKGGKGEGKRLVWQARGEGTRMKLEGGPDEFDGDGLIRTEFRECGQDDFIEVRSKKSVQTEKREQLKHTVPDAKKPGKTRKDELCGEADTGASAEKKGKQRGGRSTALADGLLEQNSGMSASALAAMAAASAASVGFQGVAGRMPPPGVGHPQADAVNSSAAHAWGTGANREYKVPSFAQIQQEELTKSSLTEPAGTVDLLPATLETPPDKKSSEQGKGSPGEGLPTGIFSNSGLPADGIGLPTDLSLGDLTHGPVRSIPQGLPPSHFAPQHLSHAAFLPMAGFPQGPLGAFAADPLGPGGLSGRSGDVPSATWVQQQATSSTQDSFYATPQPFPNPFPPPQAQQFAHASAGQYAALNTATQFGQFGTVNFAASYLAGSGKQPDWKHIPSTIGPEPTFGQGLPEAASMQRPPSQNEATNQWAAATFGVPPTLPPGLTHATMPRGHVQGTMQFAPPDNSYPVQSQPSNPPLPAGPPPSHPPPGIPVPLNTGLSTIFPDELGGSLGDSVGHSAGGEGVPLAAAPVDSSKRGKPRGSTHRGGRGAAPGRGTAGAHFGDGVGGRGGQGGRRGSKGTSTAETAGKTKQMYVRKSQGAVDH